jgi:hypothetical protein
MGEKTEKNIMYYMLISNNKQLKYRGGGSDWECGILPRDNMSHIRMIVLEPVLIFRARYR